MRFARCVSARIRPGGCDRIGRDGEIGGVGRIGHGIQAFLWSNEGIERLRQKVGSPVSTSR
ncbi:MAG: hypothetical protein AVDCRST_MAG87-531 [uncultured Thermomicrobiales bacterium]|uniref:Uncharacterized protein n=1 Tax=uncultured Thermomicrobiales bacterium TaxID=1645740 RepID=A0A6J4UD41_9BACT|nr:MAG: hypothetical protein AVDCRST_MAG87-531 [uncultured Thermomicrobiales bacterium]